MKEIWKDIKGYEGLYQVSNLGKVRSLNRYIKQKNKFGRCQYVPYKGRILKGNGTEKSRYELIDLHKEGKTQRFLMHRLVAETFLDNPNHYKYVNHKDNNTKNNRVDNLEWCTQSYNIQYSYDTENKIPPHMKAVNQYSLSGELIKTWKSLSEAGRELNIQPTNIRKVCLGERNHAGGYKWKYSGQIKGR